MIERFTKDESGVTMGLAIIMIVLISVMGAGLLTFVSRDLNNVVEVNQGQRAFEMADAGVQAAKRQLASSSNLDYYDGNDLPVTDVQWAESKGGVTLTDLDGDGDPRDQVTVKIQSLPTGYFRVISKGIYGNAQRVVEATFRSVQLVNLPNAYYSGVNTNCNSNVGLNTGPASVDIVIEGELDFDSNCFANVSSGRVYVGNDANFDSNVDINGVQLYVGGDLGFDSNTTVSNGSIYVDGNARFDSNSGLYGVSLFSRGSVNIVNSNFDLGNENDSIYGNWQKSPYNSTARGTNLTGIGARGTIYGDGDDEAFKGTRSFDSTTSPRFVGLGAVSGQMNFPFDPAADMTDILESSRMTDLDIDELEAIAQRQEDETGENHHRLVTNGTKSISSTGGWSATFSDRYGYGTVVFYEFASPNAGNEIEWNISGSCSSTARRGILVVKNGSFELKDDGFNGWVVIRNGVNDGNFNALSNECMNAYINANGTINANSNATINDLREDVGDDLDSLRRIRELSWRECYNTACN